MNKYKFQSYEEYENSIDYKRLRALTNLCELAKLEFERKDEKLPKELIENIKLLTDTLHKANKYDEKETPMKPPLTWEYAKPKTRCKCSAGVEKYHSYCWNCGQKLDWSETHEQISKSIG
jgi:hypothetical protein